MARRAQQGGTAGWRDRQGQGDCRGTDQASKKCVLPPFFRIVVAILTASWTGLIPVIGAPAIAYPRSATLFEHVRQQQPTLFSPNKAPGSSAPHQPTIILRSPLHAFSLVLICLRTLLVATSSSPYLAGYRAAIVDLLVSTWPANGTLQSVDRPPSRKGKEPAHEHAHDAARIRTALAADWLALACQALDRPVQAWAAHECQALAAPVLDELRERLNAPHDDADGMDLDEPAGVVEVRKKLDVVLVETLARLLSRLKGSAGVEGVEEPGASLQQLFLSLLSTDGLKLVQTVHSGNVEVKAAALLALALPLAAGSSMHSTDASSPLSMLPLPALRALDNLLHSHGELPFPDLPVSLRPLSRVLSSAYTLLIADYDATSAEPVEPLDDSSAAPALHSRKRRRLDDVDAAPSSDGAMDVDGMTQPTQVRRRRGPWGEAVNMVLRQAREAIRSQFGSDDVHVLEVEGEAAEQTVVRLAAELDNVKPGVAVELARTIGLLACARSGCLAFTAPSDIFAETSPTCPLCDAAQSAPPPSTLPRGSRVFTNDPLEALVAVAPGVFAASPGDKVRLSVLNALARLLKHSALEHAAAQLHNATFIHLVARGMGNPSRSVRMAAGYVILILVPHSAQLTTRGSRALQQRPSGSRSSAARARLERVLRPHSHPAHRFGHPSLEPGCWRDHDAARWQACSVCASCSCLIWAIVLTTSSQRGRAAELGRMRGTCSTHCVSRAQQRLPQEPGQASSMLLAQCTQRAPT